MALYLAYQNDVWDTETFPNRIFKESNTTYQGEDVKAFEDVTPYSQEGTHVTGGLLAEMVQNIMGFIPSHTEFSVDGLSIVQTNPSGTLTTTFSADGLTITKVFEDQNENTATMVTTFDASGLVIDSTVTLE